MHLKTVIELCVCVGDTDLPSLQQQAAVHRSEPHDSIARLEVLEPVALGVQVDAQALEQLGSGRLDDRLLGRRVLGLCLQVRQQHRLGCQLVAVVCVVVGVVRPHYVQAAGHYSGRSRGGGGGRSLVGGGRVVAWYILVLIHHQGMDVVHQRLSERGQILVLVVQLLLVVVRCGETFPTKSIDEERVFLEVLLQSVLLRDDPGVLIVVVDIVVVGVGGRGDALVLPVLGVVQLLVAEVVEGELATTVASIDGPPLPRAETQHGPHVAYLQPTLIYMPPWSLEYWRNPKTQPNPVRVALSNGAGRYSTSVT